MFVVEVTAPAGAAAEFTVPSPLVALDLALHADRAGFHWRAYDATADRRPMTLDELRGEAALRALASGQDEDYLQRIADVERRAAAARLN